MVSRRRKRRSSAKRVRTRTVTVRSPRRRRQMLSGLAGDLVGGALYGAVRAPISQLARRLPVIGALGDEVALLAVTGIGANMTSGVVKKVMRKGFTFESVLLGNQLAKGALGGVRVANGNGNGGMGPTF